MFAKYTMIGLATGLVIGTVGTYVLTSLAYGHANSDSVIGTGVLGAMAGWIIGMFTAAITLALRHRRGRRTGRGE